MIHIRIDSEIENSKRRFACGLGPDLPEGDIYYYTGEASAEDPVPASERGRVKLMAKRWLEWGRENEHYPAPDRRSRSSSESPTEAPGASTTD